MTREEYLFWLAREREPELVAEPKSASEPEAATLSGWPVGTCFRDKNGDLWKLVQVGRLACIEWRGRQLDEAPHPASLAELQEDFGPFTLADFLEISDS